MDQAKVDLLEYCKKCKLCKGKESFKPKSPWIPGRGNLEPGKIMIVGSMPTSDDDEARMVFSGQIGQALESLLKTAEIDPRECYYTMAVRCAMDEEEEPNLKQIKFCNTWLNSEIEQRKPSMIIAFGPIALKSLTGKSGAKKYRGTVLGVKGKPELLVVPTFNPGYALRYPQNKDYIISDLKLAKKVSLGSYTQIPNYDVVSDLESFNEFKDYMQEFKEYAVDIETKTKSPWMNSSRILCIAFCGQEKTGWAVPLDHKDNAIPYDLMQEIKSFIKEFLLDEKIPKIFHNNVFDRQYCSKKGYEIKGKIHDTMFMAYLGVSEEDLCGLKPLALQFTNMGDYDKEVSDIFDRVKSEDKDYEEMIPFPVLLKYNAADVDATFRLKRLFTRNMINWKMQEIYKFLIEASDSLMEIKDNGMNVDLEVSKTYDTFLKKSIQDSLDLLNAQPEIDQAKIVRKQQREDLIRKVYDPMIQSSTDNDLKTEGAISKATTKLIKKLATLLKKCTPDWTYGSIDALRVLYFDVLKRDVIKITDEKKSKKKKNNNEPIVYTYADKDHASLDEEVLSTYSSSGCTISDLILGYRKTTTEYNKYKYTSVQKWIHDDGLVHPSILLIGTVTGRPAAKNPNIQQFPKDNVAKKLIRSRFKTGVIFEQDYGQNELVGLAFYSGSPNMTAAFKAGLDVHSVGTCMMFDYTTEYWNQLKKDNEKQWKAIRSIYKTIVFGLVYGRGAQSMAHDLWVAENCPAGGSSKFVPVAQEKLEKFFLTEPEVKLWIDETKNNIRKKKYCRSRYGRVRRLLGVNSNDHGVIAEALRQGVNFLIQSWSSDITLIAMCRFQKFLELAQLPVYIMGSIHDAIFGDCEEKYVIDANCALKYIMLHPPRPIDVPLSTKIEYGTSWGEKEEMHDEKLIYQQWLISGKYQDILQEVCVDNWGPAPEDEG